MSRTTRSFKDHNIKQMQLARYHNPITGMMLKFYQQQSKPAHSEAKQVSNEDFFLKDEKK